MRNKPRELEKDGLTVEGQLIAAEQALKKVGVHMSGFCNFMLWLAHAQEKGVLTVEQNEHFARMQGRYKAALVYSMGILHTQPGRENGF